MCRGSPAARAASAGTTPKQAFERINPGAVPVAPADFYAIGADQRNGYRPDVLRYGEWIQQGPSAHLFHARGARTCESQSARWKEALVTLFVPFDQEAAVLSVDCMRNGSWHEHPWVRIEAWV